MGNLPDKNKEYYKWPLFTRSKIYYFSLLAVSLGLIFSANTKYFASFFCIDTSCFSGAANNVSDIYGISIDPNNKIGIGGMPRKSDLDNLKIKWVRVEIIENPVINFKSYFTELRNDNRNVLAIVDYRTINSIKKPASTTPADDAKWTIYRRAFIDRLKQVVNENKDVVDAWEIWNEPDLFVNEAYDPKIPALEYAKLLIESRDVIRNSGAKGKIIVGGLASGNSTYLRDVKLAMGGSLYGIDGVGVHPYGQRPRNFPETWGFGELSAFIANYYSVAGIPLWITEIGTDDLSKQPSYLGNFYKDIKELYLSKVEAVFWFCYSDAMVNPYGLFTANGNTKDSYAIYKNMVDEKYLMPAKIYNPPEGSKFTSTTAKFSWAFDLGKIDKYRLTLKKSSNSSVLYTADINTDQKSVLISDLPTDGDKIISILDTYINGMPLTSIQSFYSVTQSSTAPATTQPQTPGNTSNSTELIVNASGVMQNNKGPIFKVVSETNGTKSYHGMFEVGNLKDYTFIIPARLPKNSTIYLFYCNDTSDDGACSTKSGGANRDIIFNYIKINGVKVTFNKPVVYENNTTGVMSDIKYDRANKEDGSLYDNGKIRDISSSNGNFGTYFDNKAVFYGGEKFSWGPVFNGFMPFNGAIVAKINW